MSDTPEPYPVTPDHAAAFGFIISAWAKIEIHIQTAVAGIINSDLGTALILMGDTHSRQKQQTLRHLNHTTGIDGHVCNEINLLLDRITKNSDLRNSIAHATWVKGRRSGSIKPMRLKLRGPIPKELGHWHNEQDYTVQDLRAVAINLEEISARFVQVLSETGLMQRVEANIARIAQSIS